MRYRFIWNKRAQDAGASSDSPNDSVIPPIAKRIITGGAAGTLLGGAGLGAANLYHKQDESEEERHKRIRNAAIVGALLGGTAGTTLAGAVPIQAGPPPAAPPEATLSESLMSKIERNMPIPRLAAAIGLVQSYVKPPENRITGRSLLRRVARGADTGARFLARPAIYYVLASVLMNKVVAPLLHPIRGANND